MQKINYQGVDGYFIPFSGYKQMLFVLNDFVFLQEKYDLQKAYIDKYEKNIFRKNTALGVSISFNVGIAVMAVGLGFLCYNLALINK